MSCSTSHNQDSHTNVDRPDHESQHFSQQPQNTYATSTSQGADVHPAQASSTNRKRKKGKRKNAKASKPQHGGEALEESTPGNHASHPSESGQAGVRNTSHDQRHTTILYESQAAQRSVQNTVFQGARDFTIGGQPEFMTAGRDVTVTKIYGGTHGLEQMEKFVSFDAKFDSSVQDPERRCHPGTREIVLKRIRDWIDNPGAPERIFWLYGPAGAGKSAIAQTIARSYERPIVAATFFFFRSDVSRNDGNRLFTTLAYQLASSIPAIRDHIVQALDERPDLPRTDVETQFDWLVARPFKALKETTYHHLAPVVIIDGVDECTDEKLQQRFLKAIDGAVRDNQVPLRFLICSRPEAYIEETIGQFQSPIHRLNLAELDDANHDIEKYLVDQFSRIASKQGIEPTWPGKEIIQDIIYKSSGNFIFASVVIRFVGDPDNFAVDQLNIIRNLQSRGTMTPFVMLDELFLEILRRVPDQVFLKRFLAILVARISAPSGLGDLHKDDAVLMHVSEEALHAKLRRMRSLLKFDPFIDVHHRSFFDFLNDSSRAGQYYVGEHDGETRWFELFIDSLVRYVSTVVEQPNYHNTRHFNPVFGRRAFHCPLVIRQSIPKWQEMLQSLVHLQDKLLTLTNFLSTWKILPCDKCCVSNIMSNLLLHLSLYWKTPKAPPMQVTTPVTNRLEAKSTRVVPSVPSETEQNIFKDDGDACLSSLLTHLKMTELESPSTIVINRICSILHFHYAKTAMRVRSTSDAQSLVDLIVYLVDEKHHLSQCDPVMIRRATQLALEIFARVPVLPRSVCLKGNYHLDHTFRYFLDIRLLFQTAFVGRVLGCDYAVPLVGIQDQGYHITAIYNGNGSGKPILKWRRRSKPSSIIIIQVMLKVAGIIQRLHSMGVRLHCNFCMDDVFLDSELRPKFCCPFSTFPESLDRYAENFVLFENNILSFGCLFYGVYYDTHVHPLAQSTESLRRIIAKRPAEPTIPDYAWHLIQRCCIEDLNSRPTIDEVVQEMETWKGAEL